MEIDSQKNFVSKSTSTSVYTKRNRSTMGDIEIKPLTKITLEKYDFTKSFKYFLMIP